MKALTRVFSVAASSLFCAVLAGFIALYTHGKSLPPSDGAYGMSVWESLGDSRVFSVWFLLVSTGAVLGFVFSLWALWRVNLAKAIPVVASVTIATAAGSAPVVGPLSSLVALIAGILATLWCRGRTGWESKTPMQTAGPGGGLNGNAQG